MENKKDDEIISLLEEIHQKEYELAVLKSKLDIGDSIKSTFSTNHSSANLYQDTILLREILNSSEEAIFLVDTKTDLISYCNNRAAEIFGFDSRIHLIGTRGSSLQKDPYSREKLDSIVASLRSTGSWSDEIEYVSKKGRVFWGSISATHVKPPNIEPFYLVRILDIDQRKRAEEKLRASERRFRELLGNSQAMICTHGMDGMILSVNPASVKALKCNSEEDLIGKNISMLFGEEQSIAYKDYLQQILTTGQSSGTMKVRDMHGNIQYWLYHNFRVHPEEGLPYVIGSAQDISHRIETEKALKSAKIVAEKALKTREHFLANVSHELRTPLHGIMGMATMIQESQLTIDQRQHITVMKHSAENLLVIINDILDMAKMGSGKFELEHVPFALNETILSSIEPLQLKAQGKGLDLRLEMPKDEVLLLGDPLRLSQIVINLLSNAIKFTSHGYVALSVTERYPIDDTCAKLSIMVSDTGLGIPKDKVMGIFEEYEQVHRGYGGTGLGLSICRNLVEMQGGNISCNSIEGQGSTFEVSITYQKNFGKESVKAVGIPDFNLLKGLHILLVEDNMINQMVGIHVLTNNGMNVEIAENGRSAIEKFVESKHDLILMDIQMPDMSGEETTAVIRALGGQSSKVPIVALTANAMKGDNEKYMMAGMDGYLSKPYTEEELLVKMAEVLSLNKL